MPNPSPRQTEAFEAKKFKAIAPLPEGEKLGKRPISAKVPEDVEALIFALPQKERVHWLRRVLTDAARKDLGNFKKTLDDSRLPGYLREVGDETSTKQTKQKENK